MGKFSDNRLKLSTFKLNALLDITLAINDNSLGLTLVNIEEERVIKSQQAFIKAQNGRRHGR